jgi:hypothetical protein
VHIGIQKVDGVHIVQWRRLHLLPLGTAVYYLSDPLFFFFESTTLGAAFLEASVGSWGSNPGPAPPPLETLPAALGTLPDPLLEWGEPFTC